MVYTHKLQKTMMTTATTIWNSKIYPLEPMKTILMREQKRPLLLRFPRSLDTPGLMFTLKQLIEGHLFFKVWKTIYCD